MIKLTVNSTDAGLRLDVFLVKNNPGYSRNYFLNLIRESHVSVNDHLAKASYIIKENDIVEFELIEIKSIDLKPEKIDLDILFEDDNVIVINKQPGLVVHPAAGAKDGTLVNALLYHFPGITDARSSDNEISKIRPGLVHRLDKDTSGVIIIAKNSRAMHSLSRQIQNRTCQKIYWALCAGWPKYSAGELTNFIGRHTKDRKIFDEVGEQKGKIAISKYKLLDCFLTESGKKVSLIEFDIKTGRTHQIRVQSKLMGNPVIGDNVYTTRESQEITRYLSVPRQMLHAKTLKINKPGDNKQSKFTASLPNDFQEVLDALIKQ